MRQCNILHLRVEIFIKKVCEIKRVATARNVLVNFMLGHKFEFSDDQNVRKFVFRVRAIKSTSNE